MNKLTSFFKTIVTEKLHRVIYLCLLFGFFSVHSQENNGAPEYYFNQFNTFLTTNPASIVDSSYLEIGTFYSAFSGGFSGIRNFEAYAIFRPSRKNSLIVEVNSDQQGPVFQRNRVYLGYVQRVALNNSINMQLGAKFGVVNYSFKPSLGGVGGSDFGIDGTLGLSIYTEKWLIGSSFNQFTSPELQPINQIFSLPSYWEFHGNYLFGKHGADFTVNTGLRSRVTSSGTLYQLSALAQYYSVQVGSSLSNIGYSFSAGYEWVIPGLENKKTLLSILYQVPNNNNLQFVNQSKFEIVLKFLVL